MKGFDKLLGVALVFLFFYYIVFKKGGTPTAPSIPQISPGSPLISPQP